MGPESPQKGLDGIRINSDSLRKMRRMPRLVLIIMLILTLIVVVGLVVGFVMTRASG
jgi:hypothetical protein